MGADLVKGRIVYNCTNLLLESPVCLPKLRFLVKILCISEQYLSNKIKSSQVYLGGLNSTPFLKLYSGTLSVSFQFIIAIDTRLLTLQYNILDRVFSCNVYLEYFCTLLIAYFVVELIIFYCCINKKIYLETSYWFLSIFPSHIDFTVRDFVSILVRVNNYSFSSNFVMSTGKCFTKICRKFDNAPNVKGKKS